MCGIAGIHSHSELVKPSSISRMMSILKHRGPDDEGYLAVNLWSDNLYELTGSDSAVEGMRIEEFELPANLFLGHRRLSVIDLSALGHQPMSNRDKTLWVVYNGEIYNYIELRAELSGLGYQFRTSTDTEVLLAAYEEWGERCLDKFNGMWAFVIYDTKRNALFGSRDRFGVKPLYYYLDGDHFAFASEIKALRILPFVNIQINPQAVFDYLVLGLIENEEGGSSKIFLSSNLLLLFLITCPAVLSKNGGIMS